MNDTTIGLNETKEEILACDVSDEALEAIACVETENMAFTLSFCSGLSTCPA